MRRAAAFDDKRSFMQTLEKPFWMSVSRTPNMFSPGRNWARRCWWPVPPAAISARPVRTSSTPGIPEDCCSPWRRCRADRDWSPLDRPRNIGIWRSECRSLWTGAWGAEPSVRRSVRSCSPSWTLNLRRYEKLWVLQGENTTVQTHHKVMCASVQSHSILTFTFSNRHHVSITQEVTTTGRVTLTAQPLRWQTKVPGHTHHFLWDSNVIGVVQCCSCALKRLVCEVFARLTQQWKNR